MNCTALCVTAALLGVFLAVNSAAAGAAGKSTICSLMRRCYAAGLAIDFYYIFLLLFNELEHFLDFVVDHKTCMYKQWSMQNF